MDYEDFELAIRPGTGRDYPLEVVRAPQGGEARATMRFPFDELALENRLLSLENALLRSGGRHQGRRLLTPEERAVEEFGRALFAALFTGEVAASFAVARHQVRQAGRGLRLKLRVEPPELAALPWEYLYDAGQGEYLCLSRRTPLVRYLPLAQPIPRLAIAPPLRILGLIASPDGLPALDVEQERRRVEAALAPLAGRVALTWLPGQTWRDLHRAMRSREPWHVFHFIGHGDFDAARDEGVLALAGDDGRPHRLDATRLGGLLADHDLRLVVLNSCQGARGSRRDVFSSTAAILTRRGIPAVLAMQYEISDRAAIELARTFYEAVADGLPVDGAVTAARQAINTAIDRTVEWGTPVLYLRAPDGVLFDQPAQALEEGPATSPAPDHSPSPSVPSAPRRAPEAAAPAEPPLDPEIVGWLEVPDPDRRAGWFRRLGEAGKDTRPGVGVREAVPDLVWCRVPAGRFEMGGERRALNRWDGLPVDVEYDFWMAKYPVTVAQYALFVADGGYEPQQRWCWTAAGWEWKDGFLGTTGPDDWAHREWYIDNEPVVNVSWFEAWAYTQWLERLRRTRRLILPAELPDTHVIRLPTEAEWERAARFPDGRRYPWGDRYYSGAANIDETYVDDDGEIKQVGSYNQDRTTAVGIYPAGQQTELGIDDLCGNVWEWCQTEWEEEYSHPGQNQADGTEFRVLRGGAWLSNYYDACAASRDSELPDAAAGFIGFRLVASVPLSSL
jgi:formylglycine-generating enzyme required for sulfatase activity